MTTNLDLAFDFEAFDSAIDNLEVSMERMPQIIYDALENGEHGLEYAIEKADDVTYIAYYLDDAYLEDAPGKSIAKIITIFDDGTIYNICEL